MKKEMKILIGGDSAMIRSAIKDLLNYAGPGGTVVFEYHEPTEPTTILGLHADVMLMDDIVIDPIKKPPNFARFQNNFKKRGKR